MTTSDANTAADRTPQRVRHALRFRELTVRTVQRVAPHLVRVTLGGEALDFALHATHDSHDD